MLPIAGALAILAASKKTLAKNVATGFGLASVQQAFSLIGLRQMLPQSQAQAGEAIVTQVPLLLGPPETETVFTSAQEIHNTHFA